MYGFLPWKMDFMHFGIDCSRHGLTSASCQMTIFYGGQAHVFDHVQPNKVCSLLLVRVWDISVYCI